MREGEKAKERWDVWDEGKKNKGQKKSKAEMKKSGKTDFTRILIFQLYTTVKFMALSRSIYKYIISYSDCLVE